MTGSDPVAGKIAAWAGFVVADAHHGEGLATQPGYVELGAAVFWIPAAGDAPTTSSALQGDRFCVFSGHLHNRSELAAELSRIDEPARSPADWVLRGYEAWGAGVLAKLDGVFACTVWDRAKELLICSSDPVGAHPFYYAQMGRDLVVSWDIAAVLRHPRVSRRLNRPALAELLLGRLVPEEETFFEAVRRLPGGHSLQFAGGRLQITRHWDPLPPGEPVKWAGPDEIKEFPSVLQKAVEGALQHGPAGIFLSGGLDSVSIAECASRSAAARGWPTPRAYSVALTPDEERIQRLVAQTLGLPQVFVTMADFQARGEFLNSTLDLAGLLPSPPLSFLASPYVHLQRLARSEGCCLLLGGQGGDEFLTVTPLIAADLVRSGDLTGLIRLLRTEHHRWGTLMHELPSLIRSILWNCGLREVIRDYVWRRWPRVAGSRHRSLVRRAVPEWIAPDTALRHELVHRFESCNTGTVPDGFYLNASRAALTEPLKAITFEEKFYRDFAAGISTVHPYWARSVIELLLRAPPAVLNAGYRSKALVRAHLAQRFPTLGFGDHPKRVSPDLASSILRRELPGVWKGLAGLDSLAGLGIIEPVELQKAFDVAMKSGSARWWHRAWRVASVESWSRAHA